MGTKKPTKLQVPENWDKDDDLSTKDFSTYVGGNDWENTVTAVAFVFNDGSRGPSKRVWGHMADIPEDEQEKLGDQGKNIVQEWLRHAKEIRNQKSVGMDHKVSWRPEFLLQAAPAVEGLLGFGVERVEWKSAVESFVNRVLHQE